jgi:predicted nucleotidyltransferase
MYGLSSQQIENILKVFGKFSEVESAVLFGSRAKNTYKPSSDIDVSLKGKNINLNLLSKIIHQLDDLLLPYQFDISIYHQIQNPELLDHIKRVGVTFYNPEVNTPA